MGSTSKRVNLVKQRISLVALDHRAAPSYDETPDEKLSSDAVRHTAATTDSCSRGNDNSDASDCESDSLVESPAEWTLEDATLKQSLVLTRDEVLERRMMNIKKLMKLYKTQYWALMEEARTKYRRFYLRNGKSGWRDEAEAEDRAEREESNRPADDGVDGMREPDRGKADNLHCGAHGCNAKPLPLTVFCVAHILMEPRQRLYKPCSYVHRTGQNAPVSCGRPVLRAAVPLLCGQHFQKVRKQASRSLSKVTPGFKDSSQFHQVIAQYVRVIQTKRRMSKVKAERVQSP